MKVTFSPSFKAKNKNIRRADDIQRHARNFFPAISPSYIDTFYISREKDTPENRAKVNGVLAKEDKKITAIRELAKEASCEGNTYEEQILNAPIFQIMRGVKVLKAANCFECTAITLAALAANGFYNTERVNVVLELSYINSKTKETEYKATIPLDHTVVLLDTGKDNEDRDKIVVDSWLGFADSLSGASSRFKATLINKKIEEKIKIHGLLFQMKKIKENQLADPDKDYEINTSIKYTPVEKSCAQDMAEIGYFTKCFYPELIKK